MSYLTWEGSAARSTLVCVHGLTGNASDFEDLAMALTTDGHRVVCPDVVGRGASDWLDDPKGYELRQYLRDMACLLARLGAESIDWVGTSMGGLIGMTLAAAPHTPIRRLVLNDIGPLVPSAALRRLASHLGSDPTFEDAAGAERWLREVRAPFGPLTDDEWRRMTARSVRKDDEGRLRLHYDPKVALRFGETAGRDVDLWSVWERITCPVLVLRGEASDLLLPETAREMTRRGPRAEVIELAGCGHAPALMDPGQVEAIRGWLAASAA
jgi:pimeloyl-ACP methyl ester carboxylesterase